MPNLARVFFLALISAGATNLSYADESMVELAAHSGCFICHSIEHKDGTTKPLAPSYRDIALRYQGQTNADEYLLKRVLGGTLNSDQNWTGDVSMRFMPPNVNVSRENARQLVAWITHLKVDEAAVAELRHHEAMLALATRSGCFACHLMDPNGDARLMPLAPPFRTVSKRYQGDGNAQKQLVRSITQGTRSADKLWPEVNMEFMPPNVGLTKEHAEQLAQWILELKPSP